MIVYKKPTFNVGFFIGKKYQYVDLKLGSTNLRIPTKLHMQRLLLFKSINWVPYFVSKIVNPVTDLNKRLIEYAVYLLSRRDYSTHELTKKLRNKFSPNDESEYTAEHFYTALQQCLSKVIEYGYLNDERYSEAFVRSSCAKFRGPLRIRNELKQKGLPNNYISNALENDTIDWFELARTAFDRKFGPDGREGIKADQKLKAKCYRYLSYRGFTSDQINYAFDAND